MLMCPYYAYPFSRPLNGGHYSQRFAVGHRWNAHHLLTTAARVGTGSLCVPLQQWPGESLRLDRHQRPVTVAVSSTEYRRPCSCINNGQDKVVRTMGKEVVVCTSSRSDCTSVFHSFVRVRCSDDMALPSVVTNLHIQWYQHKQCRSCLDSRVWRTPKLPRRVSFANGRAESRW